MNSKLLVAGLLLAAGLQGSPLWGQTANASGIDSSARQNSLAEGRRLFEESSDDAGESTLQSLNRHAMGSGPGQMEIAMNLLRVAFACKESNDEKTAHRVAMRALAHLDVAERKLGSNERALASIYQIRGVISERLLGTTAEAVKNYQAALKHQPENKSVQAKLAQIGAVENQVGGDTK
ncbi:MAG: hypothetical protein JF599_02355 [Verrucomicrobia bacterium]|nr:hypothetical protein [Verrucomicrobiota bacterium]